MARATREARRSVRGGLIYALLALALLAGLAVSAGPRVGAALEALTPPRLPEAPKVAAQVWRGDQNWSADQAAWFHHASQGTQTFPIPLPWFLALEEPLASPFAIPFEKRGRFADEAYLVRFGFIPEAPSVENPHGLPIGMATTPSQTIAGVSGRQEAIGLTCAACHTGQIVYNGKRYVIDGGPAATDLGQLTVALGAALGQTAVSAKLPLFGGRFERFAKAVLGTEYSDQTRNELADDLDRVIGRLAREPSGVDVTEGFGRLDALNRIGNQVFALDTGRYGNYANIDAPVKYPHIWTSPWFDWVQYDGSIMQPLVRNAGEALGVAAQINFTARPGEGRFASQIQYSALERIERSLAGAEPLSARAFTGLNAPGWPQDFPAIDTAKAAAGAKLYDQLCSRCHLPALTPEIVKGKAPDAPFWSHFHPVKWSYNGEERQTSEALLSVKIVPQTEIGTDPGQGAVLATRLVDTAGAELAKAGDFSPSLGVDADICLPKGDGSGGVSLETVRVKDFVALPFPAALGAVVQMANDQAAGAQGASAAERAALEGDRPNCLLAGAGYKARPLNGIWASPPYLHNGSVPTLYDLLSPVAERPKAFLRGDPAYDPVRGGLVVKAVTPNGRTYDENGYFVLDTSRPGNLNIGHEFAGDGTGAGVIGPGLTSQERYQIVEFLKTL